MKKTIIRFFIPALILASLLMGGCTRGFNINIGSPFNGIEKKAEESTKVEMLGTDRLQVVNQTGNVDVSKTGGSNINVRIEKKVRGQVDDEVKKVLDEIKISAQYQGDEFVVKAVASDGKTDFWSWKQQNYPMLNVNVDFYVEIPDDFANYEVRHVTGNIDMNDLTGKFSVNHTTGNVTMRNITMTGNNEIKLTTGNITISSGIADADSLYVSNVTGNVDLSFPGDSNASFRVSLTTGTIQGSLLGLTSIALGGSTVDKTVGNGKTDVKVENTTGNISVNKR